MATILGAKRARTLYNLADAVLPESLARAADGSWVDVLPEFERVLRHQGLGRIRRTWLLLTLLDYGAVFTGSGRRFWRLDREARCQVTSRLARLPGLGAPIKDLCLRVESAAAAGLAATSPGEPGSSAPAAPDSSAPVHSLDGA